MEVFAVRHRWPEKADFVLERKNGTDDFVFRILYPKRFFCVRIGAFRLLREV